jgi:hypothetical protein
MAKIHEEIEPLDVHQFVRDHSRRPTDLELALARRIAGNRRREHIVEWLHRL